MHFKKTRNSASTSHSQKPLIFVVTQTEIKYQTHSVMNVVDKLLTSVYLVLNITSYIPWYQVLTLLCLCILWWVYSTIETPSIMTWRRRRIRTEITLSALQLSTVNCCRTPPCSAPHSCSTTSREKPQLSSQVNLTLPICT